MTPIVFDLPLRTTNPLNGGMSGTRWEAIQRSRTRAEHRLVARMRTTAALRQSGQHPADVIPCVVTLTRFSAGHMDTDGLAASLKGIRDGIADALGVNDGGPMVDWVPAQAKCPRGVFGVRVCIEKRESAPVEAEVDVKVKRKRRPEPPDEVA